MKPCTGFHCQVPFVYPKKKGGGGGVTILSVAMATTNIRNWCHLHMFSSSRQMPFNERSHRNLKYLERALRQNVIRWTWKFEIWCFYSTGKGKVAKPPD